MRFYHDHISAPKFMQIEFYIVKRTNIKKSLNSISLYLQRHYQEISRRARADFVCCLGTNRSLLSGAEYFFSRLTRISVLSFI